MARHEVFTDIDKWVDEVNSKPAFVPTPKPRILEPYLSVHQLPPEPVISGSSLTAQDSEHAPVPDFMPAGEEQSSEPTAEVLLTAERVLVEYGKIQKLNFTKRRHKFDQIRTRSRQLRLRAVSLEDEILRGIGAANQPVIKSTLVPNNGYDIGHKDINLKTGLSRTELEHLTQVLKTQDLVPLVGNYFDSKNPDLIPPDRKIHAIGLRVGFEPGQGPTMPRLILGKIIFVHTQDAEDYLKYINIQRNKRNR